MECVGLSKDLEISLDLVFQFPTKLFISSEMVLIARDIYCVFYYFTLLLCLTFDVALERMLIILVVFQEIVSLYFLLSLSVSRAVFFVLKVGSEC